MRILRIKRGFTTNSSSGNEFALPPRDHPQYREYYEYLQSEGRLPPGTLPPLTSGEVMGTKPDAPSNTVANLGVMGALVAAVTLVFLLGRRLRRWLAGRRR